MRLSRAPLVLLATSLACASGGETESSTCSVGERADGDGCTRVPSLQVNVDERLDVRDGTARRGIGAFACTLEPLAHEPVDEAGACVLFQFEGDLIADGFLGDGGALLIELDDPITMVPDPESSCYASDLFPSRDDLFAANRPFRVRSQGGEDFPAFNAVLVAPETLATDVPDDISRSADLEVQWLPSDADVMLFVLNTYDPDEDRSARIVCVFDDAAGKGTVDTRLLGGLLPNDEEAALTYLRQRVTHLEPADADVSIDLIATSSVIRNVPLVP